MSKRNVHQPEDRFAMTVKRIEACHSLGRQGTELDLSGLGLTMLPPAIGKLVTLTKLDLHNNQLTTLPPAIGQLTALTSLYLNDNHFTTLPPVIGQLMAL